MLGVLSNSVSIVMRNLRKRGSTMAANSFGPKLRWIERSDESAASGFGMAQRNARYLFLSFASVSFWLVVVRVRSPGSAGRWSVSGQSGESDGVVVGSGCFRFLGCLCGVCSWRKAVGGSGGIDGM